MKNIIKSYVKSYFKNWIEAIGLIIFMLIIFAISTGLLAGPIQYQTEYNKIVNFSQKWDQSFNLDPKKSDTYFKDDFLVQLLTQESTSLNNEKTQGKWTANLQPWPRRNSSQNSDFKLPIEKFFQNATAAQWQNYQTYFKSILNADGSFNGKYLVNPSQVTQWSSEALDKVNGLGISDKTVATEDYFNILNESIINYFDQYHLDSMTGQTAGKTQYTNMNSVLSQSGYDYRALISNIILANNPNGWSYNFMNNLYAAPKQRQTAGNQNNNPDLFLSSSTHFTDNQKGVNNLKLYSGDHNMIKQKNSYFINYGSAYKNKIDDTQKNWQPIGANGPKINLLGSALTLENILAKKTSSIYEQVSQGGGNPTSGVVSNYVGLYGTQNNITSLASQLKGTYDFNDASEIYYKIPTNFQGFRQAFSPFFTKTPILDFSSSSIERLLQGINITTLLFVGITALLLLQGFIFINFTMKKEINKTKSQLGIFKSFGYKTSQLSWAFATKFFLTTFVGALIGYTIGLAIQNFIAPQYTNSLYLPFVNLYAGGIFLTIYFVIIPIIFTLISYLLTLYYLRQPALKLMKGSIGRKLGIISRGIKVGLRKTNFIFRAQVSFTLQSLGRFAAVMALFFFSVLLLFIIFDSNELLNSTFKNLFDTYSSKVDHISRADSTSTADNYNPSTKHLELANSNPNAYKPVSKDYKGYYQSYSDLKNLKGIPNNEFQKKYMPDYGKTTYFGYTIGDLEKYLQNPSPKNLPFWFQELLNSNNADMSKFGQDMLNYIEQNPLTNLPKAINYILIADYEYYYVQGNTPIQIPGADQPDLANQINSIGTLLNTNPNNLKGVASIDNLTHLVSTLNAFYSNYEKSDFAPTSSYWDTFTKIVNGTTMPPLIPPTAKSFKPTFRCSIPPSILIRPYYISFKLGQAPTWFNKISLLAAQIINQKTTYVSFNKLYYEQGKELPEFQMALAPKNAPVKSNLKDFEGVGIDNRSTSNNLWQQLYQFQGVSQSAINDVLNQKFNYDPTKNNVLDAVVSNRVAAVYNAKVGDTIPLDLTNGTEPDTSKIPNVSLKIVGIATKDTLSNNIYTSASALKSFYQGPGDVTLSPSYFNSVVSENPIIPEHVDIKKFLAGQQQLKFALNTLGVSFLNPPPHTNFTMANALGATQINGSTAPFYDVNGSTSSLIDPTKSLPINIIRQTGQQLLGNIKDVFAVIQTVIAVIVFVLFLVVISSIIDESIRIILTMRALGHKPRNINFIIIGNYVIGIVVFAVLAYLLSVGIWLGVVQFVFTSFGILLTPPLGLTTPLIIAAIVAVILVIAWAIAKGLIRTKSITQITSEE